MKYGLNLLLWTDRMHEGLVPVLGRVKALGYDGVEIPIFELNEPLHAQWGRRLDDLGLERTAVTVRNAGDNPISPSATVRAPTQQPSMPRRPVPPPRSMQAGWSAGCRNRPRAPREPTHERRAIASSPSSTVGIASDRARGHVARRGMRGRGRRGRAPAR
jgi:hypothetical protein